MTLHPVACYFKLVMSEEVATDKQRKAGYQKMANNHVQLPN